MLIYLFIYFYPADASVGTSEPRWMLLEEGGLRWCDEDGAVGGVVEPFCRFPVSSEWKWTVRMPSFFFERAALKFLPWDNKRGKYMCCPVFDQCDGCRLICAHTLALIYSHVCTDSGTNSHRLHYLFHLVAFKISHIQFNIHRSRSTLPPVWLLFLIQPFCLYFKYFCLHCLILTCRLSLVLPVIVSWQTAPNLHLLPHYTLSGSWCQLG